MVRNNQQLLKTDLNLMVQKGIKNKSEKPFSPPLLQPNQ